MYCSAILFGLAADLSLSVFRSVCRSFHISFLQFFVFFLFFFSSCSLQMGFYCNFVNIWLKCYEQFSKLLLKIGADETRKRIASLYRMRVLFTSDWQKSGLQFHLKAFYIEPYNFHHILNQLWPSHALRTTIALCVICF